MIKLKILVKKMELLGVSVSDKVSRFVGSWRFVFFYTATMAVWIGLHLAGVLDIDSKDFIKWNLWLSYFAGTQASLVLMSSTRQYKQDKEEQKDALEFDIKTLRITEDNNKKIKTLANQIDLLEDIIEDFFEEQNEKKK